MDRSWEINSAHSHYRKFKSIILNLLSRFAFKIKDLNKINLN